MGIGDLYPNLGVLSGSQMLPAGQPQQPYTANPLSGIGSVMPTGGGGGGGGGPFSGVQIAPASGSDAAIIAQRQQQHDAQAAPASDWMNQAGAALNRAVGTPQTQQKAETTDSGKTLIDPNASKAEGGGQPGTPFHAPPTGYVTTKAHDQQNISDVGLEVTRLAKEHAVNAIGGVAAARVQENEENQQAITGYRGTMEGARLEQSAADEESMKPAKAAFEEVKKASAVDPNHYMSSMSVGKRMMLTVAAALMQGGMALRGQSGKNPILEQIEQETQRDIDAQKDERAKKLSVYSHAREQGLTEKQAHALTYAAKTEQAKLGLDAAVMGNHSPVLTALADEDKAKVDDSNATIMRGAYSRVQAQTAAVGGIPQEVKDLAKKIRLDPRFVGDSQAALSEAARTLNYDFGGPRGEFAPPTTAGAGRQAGVQVEHRRMIGRYDSALKMLDMADQRLAQGYEWGGDKPAQNLNDLISQDVSFVMHGGAGEGAAQKLLESMPDLNTSKGRQWAGGNEGKKVIAQLRKIVQDKRDQEVETGKAIPAGTGWGSPMTSEDAAAAHGAKED